MDDQKHQRRRSSVFVENPVKPKEIVTKNKSENTDSTNNSLVHPEETLQATTRSGHNGRGLAKAQTELTYSVFQAERILNMCEIGYEIHISEFFIQIWRNNSYIVQH